MPTSMPRRHIFHLSIPVIELAPARQFYVHVLNATPGRATSEWLDVLLWGHQITLQERPDEVVAARRDGKFHFGVVLPWHEWESEARRIQATGVAFLEAPRVIEPGTPDEHAKFHLSDPSGNVIEVKAYRSVERTLGLAESPWT